MSSVYPIKPCVLRAPNLAQTTNNYYNNSVTLMYLDMGIEVSQDLQVSETVT